MTTAELQIARAKRFVVRHKTKIAVIATATVCLAVNQIAVKQHDDFLKEHDLYDAFYTPEDSY
jgi:hypothetical protein